GASRARRDVADGTVSVMEFFARLIVDHMTRDDAERAEQRALVAEEQLRERSMFLAQAEHKLKTPLAVISGFVRTLRTRGRTMPETDEVAALEIIERNSALLGDQVNMLLEEAMAEVRARDLHPVAIDRR